MRVTGVRLRPSPAAGEPAQAARHDDDIGLPQKQAPEHGGAAGLTQKRASRRLAVSVGWLRHSNCPKVLLPGNGPRGKPLLRYFREDVLAWAKGRDTSATATHDGALSATAAKRADPGENSGEISDPISDDFRALVGGRFRSGPPEASPVNSELVGLLASPAPGRHRGAPRSPDGSYPRAQSPWAD
jgi:hypothetical protein